MIALKV